MIKCEVLENFTLQAFEKIKDIKRANSSRDEKGKLYVGDTFECDKEMAKYLTGKNALNKCVVKVIEVEPEKAEPLTDNEEPQVFVGYTQVIEEKPKKKTTTKKSTKKKEG